MPLTTLASFRNANNAFTKNGGDYGVWATTDPLTGALSSTFGDMPVIQKTSVKDETEQPSEKTESGAMVYLSGGDRKASVEFDFLQQDADSMNIPLTYGGKTFCVVKQVYDMPQPNGKSAFMIFPNAKLEKKFGKDSGTVASKVTMDLMPSVTSLTLNLTSITAAWSTPITCGSYVVPVKCYEIIDAI